MTGGFILVLSVMAILAAILLIGQQGRLLNQRRSKHLLNRQPIGDAVFLADIGAPAEDQNIYLAIRRSVAEACDIPAEMVHPQDSLDQLGSLIYDGLMIDLVQGLEKLLPVKVSGFDIFRHMHVGLCGPWNLRFDEYARNVRRVLRDVYQL